MIVVERLKTQIADESRRSICVFRIVMPAIRCKIKTHLPKEIIKLCEKYNKIIRLSNFFLNFTELFKFLLSVCSISFSLAFPFHLAFEQVELITQKPVFHFNRIVAKRSVFHCFVNTQAELMIWT